MTHPQDPRKHPLQDDEIALARVLRALPVGEPPARVDAAILAAATDALSPRPRKPAKGLRWLPTWAVGTAAAAVLAVGIGIQLRPPLVQDSLPQASRSEHKTVPESRERLSVDLVEPERELAPMPPPPQQQPSPARRLRPAAPPPPPPTAQADAAAEAFPEEAAPVAETADTAMAEEGGAFAPPPASAPAASEADAIDNVDVTGSRLRRSDDGAPIASAAPPAAAGSAGRRQSALARDEARVGGLVAESQEGAKAEQRTTIPPPVAEDALLAPRDWIERIRDRRNQGDRAGARASLMLYIRTYPDAPIPTDLARLR